MRVPLVGNLYPPHRLGGYELIWRSSVHHLRAVGNQVRVLTSDHAEAEPDAAIAEDSDVHRELRWYWREHRFPACSLRARLAIERHNLAVCDRHLAELRPDAVIWWHMGGMSMSLLARARERGVAALGAVHDERLSYGPRRDGWQRAFGRALELGLDVAAAPVIHSGIDLDRFPARPEPEWRGRLLCLGRIDPRKGVTTVIEALPRLPGASLWRTALGPSQRPRRSRRAGCTASSGKAAFGGDLAGRPTVADNRLS